MAKWERRGESISTRIFYIDDTGKRRQKRYTFKNMTERQATKELNKLIALGVEQKSNATLNDIIPEWWATKTNLKPNSASVYRIRLNSYILPVFGNIRLTDVSIADVQKFLNKIAVQHKTLAAGILMVLDNIMQFAVIHDYIQKNPVKSVIRPRLPQKTIAVLTTEQADIIKGRIRGTSIEVPISIIFYTAMRRGEVCGLKWTDIDFEKKIIHIRRNQNYIQGKISYSPPKNGKSRDIALSDTLADILQKEKAKGISEYVCTSARGNNLIAQSLQQSYLSLIRDTGMSTHLHTIRHSVITWLIQSGVPIKTVSELAGHSNVSITLNIYTHVSMSDKTDAIKTLDDLLS